MAEKAVNTTGLIETWSGAILREVTPVYTMIDPHGGSDDVQYKSYITCLETLLNDRGIGDELAEMLRVDGIRLDREDDVSDWFGANQKLVEEILEREGYRVITVLTFKETGK